MRVLVTGGTGHLGSRLVPRLEKAGHEVVVGTRTPSERWQIGFDLGEAPDVAALDGVDVVVHLATDPFHPDAEVGGSARLWEAARRAGACHGIYVSIVGIDHHPFRYYRTKREVEELLEGSGLPYTILRTTQFHALVPRFVEELGRRTGVVAVPAGLRFQPIDADDVADRLTEIVEAGPSGRVPDMGGPEVLSLDAMVSDYLRASGRRWLRFRAPYWGKALEAFRRGDHLAPQAPVGERTYRQFLEGLPRRPADPAGGWLRFVSLALFATMVWMLVSPLAFQAGVAGFGAPNPHFVRDTATFLFPLAVALWMAASRPAWRRPVVGLALAQNGLHIGNHVADVAGSVPAWHGPVNLVALLALELVLWQIMRSPTATREIVAG